MPTVTSAARRIERIVFVGPVAGFHDWIVTGTIRNYFALVDFLALIVPTDPLGFLESGFFATSFSIRNSLAHFGQVRRDIGSFSMIVPMTKGLRQCGQEIYNSRYGSLTARRAPAMRGRISWASAS
jgi:hypothetical protein